MSIESRLNEIEREAESLPLRWGGSAISTRSVKALVAVARAAEKYDREMESPIPDITLRVHYLRTLKAALRALEEK